MRKLFLFLLGVVAFAGLGYTMLATGSDAMAYYFQGFEVDDEWWLDSDDSWYGTVTRTMSSMSFEGDYHAVMEGDASSAPFSRFDGYRETWPGTWVAELAVFLDPAWAAGTGFDYSVAANGQDGNHQRDYIFHVTSDSSEGALFVAASNNTNFAPREDLESINHHEITTAGWYVMQHKFYEDSGALAVDLNLLDEDGNVLFTETRYNPADSIATEVGGNRYAWFTFLNVDGGVAVDNHKLYTLPMGMITSPEAGDEVMMDLMLEAVYYDDDNDVDDVFWAIREGTCDVNAASTVAGNVAGYSDAYLWDGINFSSNIDISEWMAGEYCFIFNPGGNDNYVRETVEFMVLSPDADGDGVYNDVDYCPDTEIDQWILPSGKRTVEGELGMNRWMWDETTWVQLSSRGKRGVETETNDDLMALTAGCSCEQILTEMEQMGEVMKGHWKFGCSTSVVMDWVEYMEEMEM